MSLNLESSLAMLMAQSARRSAMATQAGQQPSGVSGAQQPADLNAAAARNDAAGQSFRAFNASASAAAAPAMPGSGATASPAAASTARTNQDLINGYYKAGGGTWEGASRAARADGQNLNALVRNRQAAAGSTSAPTTPGTGSGSTSGGASANPGTSTNGTSGTTAVNDAPAAGSVNERIAQATRNYMGTSTRSGPDGGNLACAWAVNNIMAKAGLPKIGANTNGVASVETALKNGKGTRVDASQAKPGDIVIWPAPKSHIGIYMGDGKVANNSSSKASFSNMSNLPAGSRIYRVNG